MTYFIPKSSVKLYRTSNVVNLSSHPDAPVSTRRLSSHSSAGERFNAKRRRGIVLTQQGWQKLSQAGVLCDKFGNRYTYEQLSERSLLDNRTVSRILSCETKVDKRTLKTFFETFSLRLDVDDYTVPESQGCLVGTLTHLGILEENAPKYDIALKAGKLLVIVASTDEELQRVQRILQNADRVVSEPVAV